MLELIQQNVEKFGYHVYHVSGATVPGYAYTIGLMDSMGAELILAGATFYMADEVRRILESGRLELASGNGLGSGLVVDGLGSFRIQELHRSWIRTLMLGAVDFYHGAEVRALQFVPDHTHMTIDVPDLSKEWSASEEPAWQWLHLPWSYDVPPDSTATTNLDALRGARITEVTRWEAGEWEMFAGPGPDVSYNDARVVPLGTLLASDPTLSPAVNLEIGCGLWRDGGDGGWNPWRRAES